jgi:molybdenum cofactor biosynthesis enzyme MoaA
MPEPMSQPGRLEDLFGRCERLLVARTFVGLGVDKIRPAGGEPLVCRNFPWPAARIRELIKQAVQAKPPAHEFELSQPGPRFMRFMSRTGG